jgi:hypothetical protein
VTIPIARQPNPREASELAIGELLTALQGAYGDALLAVVQFGSSVAGELLPNQSDTNLLVVVDAVPVDRLLQKSEAVRRWTAAGHSPPLLLTDEEWRSSSDVFALEYSDILHRHQVRHGRLPLEGISVARADLRLNVEREAMGKLLQLRRAIMAVGADGASQLQILSNGLSTLMVIFRGVVRVDGQEPPTDYVELSVMAGRITGFDATPFVRLVPHVRTTQRIPETEAPAMLAGVLAALEIVVAWLDRAAVAAR